ncbi:hypothetical protein DB30_07679 [Enhygromyxa salina]|uniref:Uncharacterized protein n=1 Tax=Enhygromyxa salina TaxID=215803 RepID=A0A0C1ZMH4_9BACT|nr:hypothetical protein [Enhygromyxa salina]KIG18664.1 hypothetical protein DB30_07679 [Enhygromyxa salina]
MAHVVMHCAQFPSDEGAIAAAEALEGLRAALVKWERDNHNDGTKPAAPCLEFATRRSFIWPSDGVISLKHGADEIEVLQVDTLVFFYGGGFELGGAGTERAFEAMGAARHVTGCHVVVEVGEAAAAARELAAFLDEEDFAGQYSLVEGDVKIEGFLHSIAFVGAAARHTLCFDDSGVQDWAFVAAAPQLSGMGPRLR